MIGLTLGMQSVAFLDLHLSIVDGFVSCKIYDKRDDFEIVNLSVLDGIVPRAASYSVYISLTSTLVINC